MTVGRVSSRLEAQAAEQRWAHSQELAVGAPIEFVAYVGRETRVLTGEVEPVRRQAADAGAPETRDSTTAGGLAEPADAPATRPEADAPQHRLLVIDLLAAADVDTVATTIAESIGDGRPTIIWARPTDLPALLTRLVSSAVVEIFDQVSVEGVMLAPREAELLPATVAVDSSLREGPFAAVLCANLAGRAERAAAAVGVVEAGDERTHLIAALSDLRSANAALGKLQRGKSQAAAAVLVYGTEKRIVEEFEERQRVEKGERDAWVAGLQQEIADLKSHIESIEGRLGWRLVNGLDRSRQRLRRSGPS